MKIIAVVFAAFLLVPVGLVTEASQSPAAALSESVSPDIRALQQVAPGEGWLDFGQSLFWTNNDGADWQDITPPQAGRIGAVVFTDGLHGWTLLVDDGSPAVLYSLAITVDGGRSWQVKSLDLPEVSQSPAPVSAAYMGWRNAQQGWLVFKLATGSNFSLGLLFITADGGDTWQSLDIPLGEPAYFSSDQTGWVAGGPAGNQLYRTVDGGQTWQLQQVQTDGTEVFYALPKFENESAGLLPVVTVDGENLSADFYRTPDGGQTWALAAQAPLEPGTPPGLELPLTVLDSSDFVMVVPNGVQIARMEGGQLSALDNADGLAAGIVALSMSTADAGWGKWVSATCAPAPPSDGGSAGDLNCTRRVQLLSTADGGGHWRPLGIPGTSETSLEQSISVTDKTAGALQSGSLSAQDADTQPYAGHGFDLCSIPSLGQMQTWWNTSPYNAVNLYIGGSMRACANTILSASFLFQLSAQGWRFIPTWVGPQASCSIFSTRMSSNAGTAYAQGVAQADQALGVAAGLGLTEPDQSGTVIYYDLEAYDTGNTTCRNAANSFVSGWVAEMRAKGNLGAMYGASCSSAVTDWASLPNVPDAVWIANWYGNAGTVSFQRTASVWGAYCLSDTLWPNHQRLRQYAGDHNETWGGLTLDIDSNVLDGPLTVPSGSASSSTPGSLLNPGPADGSTLERNNNTVLTWKSDGDSCSVHIWGGSIDLTVPGGCSSYTLGARPGGAYSWQVTATNGAGTTAGPIWHFNIKPYAASALSGAAASATRVNLNWQLSSDEPANVDGYQIYADGLQAGGVGSGAASFQVTNLACASSHSFYVVAVRQGVRSNSSNPISVATPSCAPVVNSPPDGSVLENRRPAFDWQAVADTTSYNLQVSPYSNFSSLLINAAVSSTTYTTGTDLAANTRFYWRVRANGPFGHGDWSVPFSFTTANPPAMPIQASPASNALVSDYTPRLDWNDVSLPAGTFLDHYQVQVSTDLGFAAPLYDETTAVSEFIIPADLQPDTRYYWQVRAYNTLNQFSPWSAKRVFRTVILPPDPAAPANGSSLLSLRPIFDWNDVGGASSYYVQISRVPDFSTILRSATPMASAYALTSDLPAGVSLYWRVQARGANGPSLWSLPWSFVTATPPGTPLLLSPASNALLTDYTPRLDWSTASVPLGKAFDYYELQVATDSAFTAPLLDEQIHDLTGSEFTLLSDLPVNAKYYWRVRAFDGDGQYSSWSAVRYFRAALLPPILSTPSDLELLLNRRPSFAWGAVAGAGSYTLQVSRYPNFSILQLGVLRYGTTYVPATDMSAATLYYWRVRTNGTNGPSLWSDTGTFTTGNPPGIPALTLPANGGLSADYTPTLQWKAASLPAGTAIDHYRVQVASDPAFTLLVSDEQSGVTQFTPATDLAANVKYYWRVSAYNTSGEDSAWSAVWTFRTAILPPALSSPLTGAVLSGPRPPFDWENVSGAGSYTIQVSLFDNFSSNLISAAVVPSAYTPGVDLPRGAALYWRVRANGANGPSLWSEVRSFVIP
jgi:glycoside hydrolase-like protein